MLKPLTFLLAVLLFTSAQSKSQDYARMLELSFLFYECQRSGPLPDTNRIWFRHDTMLDAGKDVGLDLTGGYYDAGDNVKFLFPGASALTLIVWSGIEFKDAYVSSGQWKYLLEMVKWDTDYFIKCHPEKNVLYVQVGNGVIDHGFWAPPEYMWYEYPAYKCDVDHPGSEVAGETAASMAAASILFKDEDSTYAATLLKHAEEIYEFADTYRGTYSISVPEAAEYYGTAKSYYEDELAWGALWLYRATGNEKYKEKFLTIKNTHSIYADCTRPISWEDKYPGVYVLAAQLFDTEEYHAQAKKYCQVVLDQPTTPGGLYYHELSLWGSNRYAANAVLSLAMYANILPESDSNRQTYIDYVKKQIDYILGNNPLGINFVVGAEKNSPNAVHHRGASYTSDNQAKPYYNIYTLYGALAGGPGKNDEYSDERTNYQMNEVAIDYNAGFTADLAALLHFGYGVKDTSSTLNFDAAWPPKPPTPDVRISMTNTTLTVSTGSGMRCGAFCVTFSISSNHRISKVSTNTNVLGGDLTGPKYTLCNGVWNNYLDGEGTTQSLGFRFDRQTTFTPPEIFDFMCDGWYAPYYQEPVYNPDCAHNYQVYAPGGIRNTVATYKESKCWPAFLCE